MRWIWLPLILLTAVHAQLPPSPPGAILIQPKPVSPKYSEQIQSWGAPMRSTPSFAPKVVTLPGFTITNLAVTGGQVTLQWKEGVPPFQVIGEPTLYGPWSDVGNPTTARTKTFPEDINHFFTVQGSIVMPLEATRTNNLTRLTWEAPDIDMSDSLQQFTLKRSTDGGATFPNTVAVVQPGGTYSVDDTTAIPAGGSLTWELLEQTLNGVVVPYSKPVASNVAPGAALWAHSYGSPGLGGGIQGEDRAYAIAVDGNNNTFVTGTAGEGSEFFGGPNLASFGETSLFIAKYGPTGNHLASRGFGIGAGTTLNAGATGKGIAVRGSKVVVCGLFTSGATGVFDFSGAGTPGTALTALGASDGFVAQYTDTGTSFTLDWLRRIGTATLDGLGGLVPAGVQSVAIDSNGNIWATGFFNLDVNFGDATRTADPGHIFLWKIRGSDGTTLFSKQILGGRPANWPASGGTQTSVGLAIALDSGDRPVITGEMNAPLNYPMDFGNGITLTCIGAQDTSELSDIFVAKFDGSGSCQWAVNHGGISNDRGNCIAIDKRTNPQTGLPFDDVIVGGTLQSPGDLGGATSTLTVPQGGFIAKYSGSNGSHKWSSSFDAGYPFPGNQGAYGLALDSSGRPVLVGFLTGTTVFQTPTGPVSLTSSSSGIFVVKWTAEGASGVGVPVLARIFNNTGGQFGMIAYGFAVAIGPDNGPVITGYFVGTSANGTQGVMTFDSFTVPNYGNYDVFVAKLSP